jgi:hypothetical protein
MRSGYDPAGYGEVEVACDVEASSEGTIEGASMMTVLVEVEVRPDWSVATY